MYRQVGMAIAVSIGLTVCSAAQAQNKEVEEAFSLENAILDTSILFAIGAREARQELRGAFGWATFQEGLVEGVYFRFDPDGYARFSPTPRLDADVFEVICRPRTLTCMGRKGGLSVIQNSRGLLQLTIENTTENDKFFVHEGISQLPLPETILQPLSTKLELLLSTEGDLVVTRNEQEIERISLKGFAAVAAYLRWVSAQQKYTALPSDWPVPNAPSRQVSGLTQPSEWTSKSGINATSASAQSLADTNVAEVKGELRVLRELLLQREANENTTIESEKTDLKELQSALEALTQRISNFEQSESKLSLDHNASDMQNDTSIEATQTIESTLNLGDRLEFLITEIGLTPEVALALLQRSDSRIGMMSKTEETNVVDEILTGLRSQLLHVETEPVREPSKPEETQNQTLTSEEYLLLSDYFRAAFDEFDR